MDGRRILIIGGGIGGLTAAIALRQRGFAVDVIEKDPRWTVYGVGIIQQANVVRAFKQLGILEDYVGAGFGFDQVEVFVPSGARVAVISSPRLVEGYPANFGIGRRALHRVLGDRAQGAGASIRLGVTTTSIDDGDADVRVAFSDGTSNHYDVVIGADGLYSATRATVFPDAKLPEFIGQSVWRYNLPRSPDVVSLCTYEGLVGVGLVPLSDTLMYMFATTAEPGNPRYPSKGLAAAMRAKLRGTAPVIAALSERIADDDEVVYKPLEWVFLEGAWHKGRVVMLGDAVHATTPHLGQGAGMAIEDGLVLAEELARHNTTETAFRAYQARRFDRCKYIVEASKAISFGQLGKGPLVEHASATAEMTRRIAEPI